MDHKMKMLMVVAGIFASTPEAYTDYYPVYGNACHSMTPGLTGEVSQHGLGNTSATQAMTVACPVTIPWARYLEGYIGFTGFDRHETENLSCTMNFTSSDGESSKSVTTSTSGFDFYRVLHGNGVRVAPTQDQRHLWVTCRIPPKLNSKMSVLTSLFLSLTY